ncbi:sensor histidine kinase [Rubrimonas cliftonensis]|uniref:histidine kinase n=1 Tax=Rubrimonas cliftonensis TaxID=89524 RepID=A0A1H3W1T4_9RHOB|nr:ATP-binding protein [Rubrimonas cliftonensis]SDZ80288.1 Histidine kinase-, DNA gyrase B-, and HSP90-like ATPase [Rubrimonas cliftonensis]
MHVRIRNGLKGVSLRTLALTAFVVLCAAAGLLQLDRAVRDWRATTANRAELAWRALHLLDAIGYRGFMQNLKNAVLHPDMSHDLGAAERDLEQAFGNLAAFDASAAALGVPARTTALRTALMRHRARLTLIPQLASLGVSPGRIDDLLMVRDEAALRDVDGLLTAAHEALDAAHAQSADLAGTAAALGVGAAVALAAGAVSVACQRAQGAARRALEIQVAERTADLSAALAKERHLSALQRRFVGLVSHEFRTPLSIVDLTMSQTVRKVRRTCDPAAQAIVEDAGAQVRIAVARLVQLIDTTLLAARIDDGQIGFDPEAVDLAPLLEEARQTCLQIFEGRQFVLNVSDDIGAVQCDPGHLRQILWNLLSNAAKYSEEGARIETSAGRDRDSGEIVITVRDSGLGIGPADLARLTERYFRGDSGEGRPGVGLGLHIVAKLLALHRGRLEVESELGRGSAFSAIFPARPAQVASCVRAA